MIVSSLKQQGHEPPPPCCRRYRSSSSCRKSTTSHNRLKTTEESTTGSSITRALLLVFLMLATATVVQARNNNNNNNYNYNNDDGSSSSSTYDDDTVYNSNYYNVYGKPLQVCSYDDTALAGYTTSATGFCTPSSSGSTTVCLNIPYSPILSDYYSSNDDENGNDQNGNYIDSEAYCTATAQGMNSYTIADDDAGNNYHAVTGCYQYLPCHQDGDKSCAVQNYCVRTMDFINLMLAEQKQQEKKGNKKYNVCTDGYASAIYCNGINNQVIMALQAETKRGGRHARNYLTVLQCLADTCNIDLTDTSIGYDKDYMRGIKKDRSGFNRVFAKIFFVACLAVVAIAYYHHKRADRSSSTSMLSIHDGDEEMMQKRHMAAAAAAAADKRGAQISGGDDDAYDYADTVSHDSTPQSEYSLT